MINKTSNETGKLSPFIGQIKKFINKHKRSKIISKWLRTSWDRNIFTVDRRIKENVGHHEKS